jgi:gamma-glutamylcyclotransferase (GGCT)/AIG2-like uncharacterized protein YtfP
MKHLAMIFVASSLVLAIAGVTSAPAAFAAPSYQMVVVPPAVAGSPTYFRINVATGQVMYIGGTQFVLTMDSAPLPQGDYHLYSAATPDGKSYWMYRMDSQSGRTWFITSGTWTEVPPPK